MIMFARIYLIMRVLREFSLFNYEYTDRFVYKETELESRLSYDIIIKSMFKQRPYFMLATYFIFTTTFLAFAVRMFERPFYDDPKVSNVSSDDPSYQDYSLFNNAWWLIVVTMTTVGYGDYYPRTHLGRMVVLIACFCGVFMVSLSVVTLTSASEFTRGEKSTYEILLRLKQRKAIEHAARKVIYYNVCYFFLKRELKIKEQKKAEERKVANLRTSEDILETKIEEKKKMEADKKNVPFYTKLRQLKDNKKRYENIFYSRRKRLTPIETMDHVRYDYSKIQKRMAMANFIETALLNTLKIQTQQEKQLKMTLNNFKRVQSETNRLSMLQRSFAMKARSDNHSTDDVEKKSYFHQTSSNSISPSGKDYLKSHKRTAPNDSGNTTANVHISKEELESKIAVLQKELNRLKQDDISDNFKFPNPKNFGRSLTRAYKINSESHISSASRRSSMGKSHTSVNNSNLGQNNQNNDNKISVFERSKFSPRTKLQNSVSSPISSEESSSEEYKDDDSDTVRSRNMGNPNITISQIEGKDEQGKNIDANKSASKSTPSRRRSSVQVKNTLFSYFNEKEMSEGQKLVGKSSGKLPIRRQGTNINLREIENLYPTIDEQESKEESVGESSVEIPPKGIPDPKMHDIFYRKSNIDQPLVERKAPKTNINRRFKSKMLSLFD
ncbi:unnamed protein product [Moneuplotes crassus]|uniref:Ion transport domain-containing protein n=1 Tax=Euplotes crassus TaxID=5936 RepID=A0AAD1XW90_EUPCR|nr:unnamed protein product [Moneuplotes crassus]